jgi:hypothetical protein
VASVTEVKAPPGAKRLDVPPSTPGTNKLIACLTALGMKPTCWRLGGGQLAVLGIRPELRLAVEVRYATGTSPTGKDSASFVSAKVHDPIGIVRNLEADYSINKPNAKRLFMSDEKALSLAAERSRKYNDGGQAVMKIASMESASELAEWLDDWIDTLGIDHKKQSAIRKPKVEQTVTQLLDQGEWEG